MLDAEFPDTFEPLLLLSVAKSTLKYVTVSPNWFTNTRKEETLCFLLCLLVLNLSFQSTVSIFTHQMFLVIQ